MRVSIVEPDGVGGMAHFAYQLCDALAEGGADVTLITSVDYELGALPHRFRLEPRMRLWAAVEEGRGKTRTFWRRRLHITRRSLRRALRALVLVREWTRLVMHLRRSQPDIVQFGMIHFPFQVVFLAVLRRSGFALAQICHEFEPREELRPRSRRLHLAASRWLYSQFAVIFFMSEATRRDFDRHFGSSVAMQATIPHGNEDIFKLLRTPEPANRYALRDDAKVILFFGGVRPSKGVPDLIEAFALLPPDPAVRLLVVGYPSKQMEVEPLRRRIAALGLEHRVVLDLRYIEAGEVAGLMERATIVVLPYRTATQSGVAQVAYSFGRPVVATEVGGLAEVVEHEGTGLLVPPQDPRAMAAAIGRLIEDPELCGRLGARAAHLSRTRYGWPAAAKTILQNYGGLLGAQDRGGRHV